MKTEKELMDVLHEAVTKELLMRVQVKKHQQELPVAVKFLKDNGASLDAITAESPTAGLLDSLPFEVWTSSVTNVPKALHDFRNFTC